MKNILILTLFFTFPLYASVVGITTYPLNEKARVLSAEMTGYMNQRNEMGAGIRYTQEVSRYRRFDVTAAGGQDSRGLTLGTGVDFELLSEDINQPRVSFKPYVQYQKFDDAYSNFIGAAPTLSKGFSANGKEFFPYLAIPSGMKMNSDTSEFVYYSAFTLGTSMPFPGAHNDRVLLSVEGSKNLGSTDDYLGCLVFWMWN